MNLDDVAAQLYALPPEEFTAARGEAVAAARTAGEKDLARQIGALRRPTVGAWLVNLLAHQRPDLIGDLLALGAALRAAQRNLRGDELRELSGQRRTMVSTLARESRALAVAAGRGVRAALPLDEVENTLTAALADPDVAEEVRLGRLVKPVEYAGFGEQPRPQLRLVRGGAAETREDTPAGSGRGTAGSGGGAVGSGRGAAGSGRGGAGLGVAQPGGSGRGAAGPGGAAGAGGVERGPGGRAGPSRAPGGRGGIAGRGVGGGERMSAQAAREAAEEAEREAAEAAAEEAARAEAERVAAEREAARQQAADQRRRQQSAHRELLAARTVLAEAEAQRVAAEKAVREARRRVEKALAAVEAIKRD